MTIFYERGILMKNVKLLQKLTESAIMIALATILSLVKVIDMPYGGSVTFASMLPLIIIAYRYGFSWGALTGIVYRCFSGLITFHTQQALPPPLQ